MVTRGYDQRRPDGKWTKEVMAERVVLIGDDCTDTSTLIDLFRYSFSLFKCNSWFFLLVYVW
jgi:hypothetical protein